MDALSASLMIKALDGLTARSVATAENIANAGTPGYRPVRVSFETALAAAALRGPDAVRNVQPTLSREDASGQGLRLDLEMSAASGTAGRYAALIEVLGRQLRIEALAVSRMS